MSCSSFCVHSCDTTGVEKIHDLGALSDYEKEGLKAMMGELNESIQKGIDFVKNA